MSWPISSSISVFAYHELQGRGTMNWGFDLETSRTWSRVANHYSPMLNKLRLKTGGHLVTLCLLHSYNLTQFMLPLWAGLIESMSAHWLPTDLHYMIRFILHLFVLRQFLQEWNPVVNWGPPVLTGQKAGWTSKPLLDSGIKKKTYCFCQESGPNSSAIQPAAWSSTTRFSYQIWHPLVLQQTEFVTYHFRNE
jgi:hypothetical protein